MQTNPRIGALAAAVAMAWMLASGAHAKGTLVYCSEGSPEGFQPQFFTTGTTFDAVSVPMFNRLVEFETGTTNIVPALAESWTVSPDGKVVTFKLRRGVKFHSNANFKPSRDFNADDVLFSWSRMADDNHPFHKITAGQTYAYFDDMGMKKDPNLNVLSKEGLNVGYIAFNVEKKPFDNKLVRQALNMAVDKEAILKAVYQGQGQVAKNPIPPILWSYNNNVKDYAYDPSKAKEMLAQAGYPNGVDVELW